MILISAGFAIHRYKLTCCLFWENRPKSIIFAAFPYKLKNCPVEKDQFLNEKGFFFFINRR